ncbi:MAG: polysaccharide biosynthesis tyrosine autokinase [Actinobacteria bacterium]|nr:polysaccharide biosynthesis tyrosine autokinase [Actinomycetota bacterium]
MKRSSAPEDEELREYIAVLLHRRWTIAVVTALVVASALFFSFRQTPMYESTTKVLLKSSGSSQLGQLPATTMETEQELVLSASVASIVAQDLRSQASTGQLIRSASVSVPVNTQVLEITFRDPDPVSAQEGAAAWAKAYIAFKQQQALAAFTQVRSGLQQELDTLQARLSDVRTKLANPPTDPAELQKLQGNADLLTSQIAIIRSQMETLVTPGIDPAEVIQPANLPISPSSPNLVRNGLLALLAGLALGVGLAFLRERLDDGLRSREELEEITGAPVLAIVPKVATWRHRETAELESINAPGGGSAEAYRTIRANLQFIARDGSFKILSVTSPSGGEGKTTTSANLAVAIAQAGKRVIVMSCDLRKPRLHRFFQLSNDFGLTSILSGQRDLVSAVQRCQVETLRVLASGPVPPNPAELLGSDEMDQLLGELRRFADFIVIDTPPLLAVSDALVLAPRSDGVLIVADAGSTSRGALAHIRDQLEQVGGRIVGGVLNNLDASMGKYYPSYYRYYSTSRYASEQHQPAVPEARSIRAVDPKEMWQ